MVCGSACAGTFCRSYPIGVSLRSVPPTFLRTRQKSKTLDGAAAEFLILADEIERLCKPQGLAILVKAQHYCMKWRGVKEPQTSMVNSIVRGDFRHDPSLKAEFFELVKQQESVLG